MLDFDKEFLDKIQEFEDQKPENQRHKEVVSLFKELLLVASELKKTTGDKSSLEAILGKLQAIVDKSDPEFPDGQNVVSAVDALTAEVKKELKDVSSEVKKLKLDPKINVAAPTVPTPQVQVDVAAPELKGLFTKLDASLSKTLNSLVKLIPEPKDVDFTPVTDLLTEALARLDDIDTGVRLKPLPGSMRVSNFSEVTAQLPTPFVDLAYDYVGFTNADGNGNYQTITYKTGGAAGTTVRTVAVTYDGSNNVTSMTRS